MPHGEVMANAYQESTILGQLAVSYVLRRRYDGPGGLKERVSYAWLDEPDQETMLCLAAGLSVSQEMERRGVEDRSITNFHDRLYTRLGITSASSKIRAMSAVRAGKEGGMPNELSRNHMPDINDPYGLVLLDLMSRDVSMQTITKLTGYSAASMRRRISFVANALGAPGPRKGLAVANAYVQEVFTKDVMYSLDSNTQLIRRFDLDFEAAQSVLA